MSKAAVFSGGGVKGAFQIGALRTYLDETSEPFGAFLGTSTGNLTAAVMAPAADLSAQRLAAEAVESIYTGLRGNRDIYRGPHWFPFQALHWLFGAAAYNPVGLRRLIDQHVQPEQVARGAHFGCGVTQLEDGQYHTIAGDDPALRAFVLASASMPVFLPAVAIGGKHYVDGGVRHMTPLREAVAWLKTQPAPHELVVFLASPIETGIYTGSSRGVTAALRVLDIIETQIYIGDLTRLLQRNDHPEPGDVHVTDTVFAPTVEYGSALDFQPAVIQTMLRDGKAALPL